MEKKLENKKIENLVDELLRKKLSNILEKNSKDIKTCFFCYVSKHFFKEVYFC